MENKSDFINKNKEMLIEEMGKAINQLNLTIEDIIAINDPLLTEKYIHNIALNIGCLTALFNQYYIMNTGIIEEDKKIGFQRKL